MQHRKQQQFLDVIDRDEAERRFREASRCETLGVETIRLDEALGRVLAADVAASVDVPSFDRSNYDGFAVRSADTVGADEESPARLGLLPETLATGVRPEVTVAAGQAVAIATGGMLPRGADAVVMIEHTEAFGESLFVRRAVAASHGVTYAGTDIGAGETVLYAGQELSSRETGLLAAIGQAEITVFRRPIVAVISTGDEIIAPGKPMRPGLVFDSNAQILTDAIRELGGSPLPMDIVNDDIEQLKKAVNRALDEADVVLLSGGTSKGAGDLCYRVIAELADPGIVAHGVALKPGKPICLAAEAGKPVVILPGFPTSAIFTFHEFVAPVIRLLGGRGSTPRRTTQARMALKVNSEIGRTEYLLVGLIEAPHAATASAATAQASSEATAAGAPQLVAYPMGKGSGSVTTFSHADGFVTIDRHTEIVAAGETVDVQLLSRDLKIADLVVIGSHCVGLDYLLGELHKQGIMTKFLAVGSTSGLEAAKRGECDVAGIHLLDETTGHYNRPFLTPDLELIAGYGRRQGVVYRRGDPRFEDRSASSAVAAIKDDTDCVMANRNQGSGTRILIDQLLGESRPPGYAAQSRSHNAVAAAVAQSRADWGVAIESVARHHELGFLPLLDEQYDFVVPTSRKNRPAVRQFIELLNRDDSKSHLQQLGFHL